MSEQRWPTALVADALEQLGWDRPATAVALFRTVRRFQLAWNLGVELRDDGDPGAKTCTALATSLDRQRRGLPTASASFSFTEFACKCRGKYAGCERILVRRRLLVALETYRERFSPEGLSIVSGYRCPVHNASPQVGSMSDSRHTTGEAADIEALVSWQAVRGLAVASGLGYQRGTGKVRHLDVRGMCGIPLPRKTPRATPRSPAVWQYT